MATPKNSTRSSRETTPPSSHAEMAGPLLGNYPSHEESQQTPADASPGMGVLSIEKLNQLIERDGDFGTFLENQYELLRNPMQSVLDDPATGPIAFLGSTMAYSSYPGQETFSQGLQHGELDALDDFPQLRASISDDVPLPWDFANTQGINFPAYSGQEMPVAGDAQYEVLDPPVDLSQIPEDGSEFLNFINALGINPQVLQEQDAGVEGNQLLLTANQVGVSLGGSGGGNQLPLPSVAASISLEGDDVAKKRKRATSAGGQGMQAELKKAKGAKGKGKEREFASGPQLPQVLRIDPGNIAIFEDDDFNPQGDNYSFTDEDPNLDVGHQVIGDFLNQVRLGELKVLPTQRGKKVVQQKFYLPSSDTTMTTARNGDTAFIPPPPPRPVVFQFIPNAKDGDLDALLSSPMWKKIYELALVFIRSYILRTWWFRYRRVRAYHVITNVYVAGVAVVGYHGQPEQLIKHATPPPPLPQHVSTGGIAPEMDIPQSRESVFQLGGLSRAPGPSISRNLRLVAPDVVQTPLPAPVTQTWFFADSKERPPTILVRHLIGMENSWRKQIVNLADHGISIHLQQVEPGQESPRYGTLEELKTNHQAILQRIDRFKPLADVQPVVIRDRVASGEITYDNELVLPFSGIAVIDFIVNVALIGGFNIRRSFYQLTPVSMSGFSPTIPVATWACSAVIVEQGFWKQIDATVQFTPGRFRARFEYYVVLFNDMVDNRMMDYLNMEAYVLLAAQAADPVEMTATTLG